MKFTRKLPLWSPFCPVQLQAFTKKDSATTGFMMNFQNISKRLFYKNHNGCFYKYLVYTRRLSIGITVKMADLSSVISKCKVQLAPFAVNAIEKSKLPFELRDWLLFFCKIFTSTFFYRTTAVAAF